MERKSIFKPCDMEYKVYDKPVRYTEDFLKELANSTINTPLVDEKHRGTIIGQVSNFTFTDGELFGDVDTENSLDDLKYSPSYDCTLIDNGDHWLATDGKLIEIALTSNPRKAILNNTAEKNGGSKMGEGEDKTKEFLAGEIDRLQKENAKLDFKAKQDKEKLSKLDEYEKELEELREWKETHEKIIEEQKPIIEAYESYQKKTHEELLEKASQGNDEIKDQLKDLDTKALETIVNLNSQEQPAKGAGANNAPGLNEGDGSDTEEAEQEERQKAVKTMFGDLFEKED